MTTCARADRKYLRRYLLLALAGVGLCLWGVYDSVYKFPRDLEMAEAFDPFRRMPDRKHRWRELYEQQKHRGWSREMPENSADVVRGYINFNRAVIGFGVAIMTFFLVKYFRTRGSWMESTQTGITTSWGQSLEFERIKMINKRKWEDKGIAKVYFEDDGGQKRRMIFDDFKYEREAMSALMALCERGRTSDQIVGGKSQAEIAAETAAVAADEQSCTDEAAAAET